VVILHEKQASALPPPVTDNYCLIAEISQPISNRWLKEWSSWGKEYRGARLSLCSSMPVTPVYRLLRVVRINLVSTVLRTCQVIRQTDVRRVFRKRRNGHAISGMSVQYVFEFKSCMTGQTAVRTKFRRW